MQAPLIKTSSDFERVIHGLADLTPVSELPPILELVHSDLAFEKLHLAPIVDKIRNGDRIGNVDTFVIARAYSALFMEDLWSYVADRISSSPTTHGLKITESGNFGDVDYADDLRDSALILTKEAVREVFSARAINESGRQHIFDRYQSCFGMSYLDPKGDPEKHLVSGFRTAVYVTFSMMKVSAQVAPAPSSPGALEDLLDDGLKFVQYLSSTKLDVFLKLTKALGNGRGEPEPILDARHFGVSDSQGQKLGIKSNSIKALIGAYGTNPSRTGCPALLSPNLVRQMNDWVRGIARDLYFPKVCASPLDTQL